MSTKRTCRRRADVRAAAPWVLCAATALYLLRIRPRLLTWGATGEETGRSYPGDELVPGADGSSVMATTLPAPPEEVWPWLVQMGYDRAGWYSWDRLDRYGEPSADRIVPEWQNLTVGQRLPATRDARSWFTVTRLEPNRALVLSSDLDLVAGRSFVRGRHPVPRVRMTGVWGFHLRPAPHGATRLVVRTRGRGRPRPLTRPVDVLLGEPAHAIMQIRQFHNLRRRVGTGAHRQRADADP